MYRKRIVTESSIGVRQTAGRKSRLRDRSQAHESQLHGHQGHSFPPCLRTATNPQVTARFGARLLQPLQPFVSAYRLPTHSVQ